MRGRGSVHLVRAFLHLANGHHGLAAHEAQNAYNVGHGNKDRILMARARIQQCRILNGWQHSTDDGHAAPYVKPERANSFSKEALEHTRRTQHRRLMAAALIWRGITLSHSYFGGPSRESASCLAAAKRRLHPETRDYLWDELGMLEELVHGNPTLHPDAPAAAESVSKTVVAQQ